VRQHQASGVRAGGGRADLLPENGPDRQLLGVDRAGDPAPRCSRDQWGQQRVGGQGVVDGDGVGIEVEQSPAAADRGGKVAQVGQGQPAGDVVGLRLEADDAVSVRQPQGATVGAVAPLLHAGDGRGGEVPEQVVGAQRAAEGEPDADRALYRWYLPDRAAAPSASCPQLARCQGEHLADGVVELADAREAGGAGDVDHGQGGGLDQQPGGLCACGPRQRQRAGTELGAQLPLELTAAVAEPRGQPGDALAVDDPVGDQSHRPRGQVGALVPLGGARGRVGPAPLAGSEPRLLGGGGARVEAHVGGSGRHDRAAGAAVDAGRHHRGEEPAVEAGVLGPDGP